MQKVSLFREKLCFALAVVLSVFAVLAFCRINFTNFLYNLVTSVTGWVIIVCSFIFAVCYKFLPLKKWLKNLLPSNPLTVTERCYVLLCGIICFIWAISFLNIGYGPDEVMRYDIPKYIYQNNALPFGDEEVLRDPIWGFSYGFLLTLPNFLCVAFMKIMRLFSSESFMLLIAARMVSVFSNMGIAYLAIRITKKIFNTPTRWIFIVLSTLIPQIVFVSSYVNNDSFGLMTAFGVIYAWICGIESRWNIKSCIFLAVVNGACLVSYRYYYSFVLCSLFVYVISFIKFKNQGFDAKALIKRGLLIIGVALIICGPIFIRAFILYGFDIFGTAHANECAQLYAAEGMKPDQLIAKTIQAQGFTLKQMLFDLEWYKTSFTSLFYRFGYMNVFAKDWIYRFFDSLCAVAVAGILICPLRTNKECEELLARCTLKQNQAFNYITTLFFAAVAGAVTLCLSIYYSYTGDYQPQGRYIFGVLPVLLLLIAQAVEAIINTLVPQKCAKKVKVAVTAILCGIVLITLMLGFMDCVKLFTVYDFKI